MADIEKLVEQLSSLTVLEAADLAKALEEKWGVSAAAAVAVAAPAAGAAAPAAEEQTEFDVILTGDGGNKIAVIKEVRAITGLGLTEARALVEAAPKAIKVGVSANESQRVRESLEAAGATVEVTSPKGEGQIDEVQFKRIIARALENTLLDEPARHLAYIRKALAPVMRI